MKEKEEESNNFLLFLIIPCNKIIVYASVSQPKAMLAEHDQEKCSTNDGYVTRF